SEIPSFCNSSVTVRRPPTDEVRPVRGRQRTLLYEPAETAASRQFSREPKGIARADKRVGPTGKKGLTGEKGPPGTWIGGADTLVGPTKSARPRLAAKRPENPSP